ncbi:MAG: NADH-quinone oxidoreductase subunit NuoE [Actinomycetota bacterium]|nr:NADH-quinone oxidoreductase subunit NuoE [Actinomycetota bacterium]
MLTSEQVNKLEEICKRHNKAQSAVIPVLQDVQELFGYVPEDAVNFVADSMGIPRSHFFGVATFYAQFHFKPRGKNIITACSGTACHVKGSGRLIDNLARELGIPEGEETSRDLQFTLEKVNCVGACSIAPVIIINKEVHGKMSSDKLMKEIKKLRPE